MDSNFFYYFFGISRIDSFSDIQGQLLKSGLEWKLSDIAYLETICHYRKDSVLIDRVHSFYREHKDKVRSIFSDSQMNFYLMDVKLKQRKIDDIYDYKIRKESEWLLKLFEKISEIYTDFCCEEYDLKEHEEQIRKNHDSFMSANKSFILNGLIKKELVHLYDTESYRLHRMLRTHLFTLLWGLQINLVAGIDGVNPGNLRDKMEGGYKPEVPNETDLEKIIATLNFGQEGEDGQIMQETSRLFAGDKFRNFLDKVDGLNGSCKESFLKEVIKRIYNDDSCVQKNDYWDMNFLDLNDDECVLTFDKRFLNILQIVKKSMFDERNKYIDTIEKTVV